MKTDPRDLENDNDNIRLEDQLQLAYKWAKTLNYQVIAAIIKRAMEELEARRW